MSESQSLGELIATDHPTFVWPSDWAATTKRLFTAASVGRYICDSQVSMLKPR